jgi:molybdopterin-synthase adenylyltransferase
VFDNSASRQIVTEHCAMTAVPTLHVGLADGYAEILWNENYRVPSAAQDDICDYPLARNLVGLAVAAASEVIVGFVAADERREYTLTLDDLRIQPFGT